MVTEVFNFLCSAFVILLLAEIAALVFVSVHETFREKRNQLRRYYKNKPNQKNDR
jgi:hypothetical protein|nr:MAG TPA: hypothetical protein [Caudoviricetes sp.]